MKPSREPYGKCACAFTDGFILTFPAGSEDIGQSARVLRFDQNWFSHFAAPAVDAHPHSLFPPRYAHEAFSGKTKESR